MPSTPANSPPKRLPSGASFDPPYGPLANCGVPNPFFYHQFADDFDFSFGSGGTGDYTITATGGSVTYTPGDGGLALFTTGATANQFASIQNPVAGFTLPATGATPPASSNSMKKMFYLCRLQLSDVTLSTFIAGLCGTSVTPFTTGVTSVLDGLYFYKAPGAANNLAVINVGSAAQSPSGVGYTNTFTIPTNAYTLTNGVNIDLGIYINRRQNIQIFVGSQLVGWIPQSGTGAVNSAGVPILPVTGPVFTNNQAYAQTGAVANPVLFTQQNLNPTLAVSNGVTAVAKTMAVDFHGAWKER